MRGIADFPDIQSDQRRIEHIEALTGVLRDLIDPNMMPNTTDFLAIYGRVIIYLNFNSLDSYLLTIVCCRWLSMHLAYWIRKWIQLQRESIWVFRSPITVVYQTLWQHSMAQHFSFEQYKICRPSIGRRSVYASIFHRIQLNDHIFCFSLHRFSYRTSISWTQLRHVDVNWKKITIFCANVPDVWVKVNSTFTFPPRNKCFQFNWIFSFLFYLFFSFSFSIQDKCETIEMNAAACSNSKCNEMIHFKENSKLPFNCNKCDHQITEKHYQMYRDVLHATRLHLDKMKMSNIACKLNENNERNTFGSPFIHFHFHFILFDFRFGHLQCIDSQADRRATSNECLSLENTRFGIRKCNWSWQIGRCVTLW